MHLTVRIVGMAEMVELNETYRHKDGVTNVLSFPFEPPPGIPLSQLGDIIVCAPVVKDEAAQQDKPVMQHWAHMVIHGLLHLLSYDHITEAEAEEMETLEVEILSGLGIPNPYLATEALLE